MADVKDDNGLKKAEEALKKAEQKLALTAEGTPAHKKAAEALAKAKENHLAANFREGQRLGDLPKAAGGVSDAAPATLDTPPEPPQPTAPTSPSDQVRNAMVGMRPEGNLGELPQLPEGREAAEAGRIQTKAEVIAEDAKTKKRRERQAKQLRKDKALGAAKKAAYDKGVAERARQAKVDSEAVRAIRERHDKDKPSALEMGFATMTGGLGGLLFGTYDRYLDSSRAANEEVENFKQKNEHDETIRKALASARSNRVGAAAGWGTTAKLAAGKAQSALTSNAYSPHLFKEGTPNPLSGIGSNKDGDSKEQVRAWFTKRHAQAIKGNKKAIQEIGAASSRIAMKEELYKPYLQKDLVIADNKDRYKEKVYASIPTLLGEPEVMMDSVGHIWHDEAAINKQIDDWETLKAYHQMFDALAASADPEGENALFAGAWADEKNRAERSDVLGNVNAMKDMAEKFKVTITSQQRNLKGVKDAGRKVADIKAKIAEHRKNGKHGTAEIMEKNELPEAEQNLDLTLLFSGHSDLKVRRGEDGSLKVSEKPDGESLIVQRLDPTSGKVIYALNDPYISSLPDDRQPAVIERANRALKLATERAAYTPPALVKVDEVGGTLTVTLNEYDEWKKNPKNKKQVAALNRIAESISRKVLSIDEISFEDLLNGDAAGYLSDEENNIMRNRYARMMILQFKEKADKIK